MKVNPALVMGGSVYCALWSGLAVILLGIFGAMILFKAYAFNDGIVSEDFRTYRVWKAEACFAAAAWYAVFLALSIGGIVFSRITAKKAQRVPQHDSN